MDNAYYGPQGQPGMPPGATLGAPLGPPAQSPPMGGAGGPGGWPGMPGPQPQGQFGMPGPQPGGPGSQPATQWGQPGLPGSQPGGGFPPGPQPGFGGPQRPSGFPATAAPPMAQRPMPGPGAPPQGPGMGTLGAGPGAPGLGASKPVFRVITPQCILSYPHLFAPHQAKGAKKAQYSAALVFLPGTDLSELIAAVQNCAQHQWGPRAADAIRMGQLRLPFRRGEEKGYPAGSWFFNARGDQQPGCVSRYAGADGKPVPITDPRELYPGAIVRASLTAFSYDNSGNRGVSFGLNNIQKLGDGERLDTRRDPREEFEALESAPADFGGGPAPGAWGQPQQPQWQPPSQPQWQPPQQPQQWGPPAQQQWAPPPPQQQWPQQGGALGPGMPF